MAWIQRFGKMVFIFLLVSSSTVVSSSGDDYLDCKSTVTSWAEYSIDNGSKENTLTLKELLFFLHIPRTGGRTYYHCILRKLYKSNQECPRSYDKLRFDPSKPNCRLMVTHDDYSLVSKLPKESTSVVTVLRNPIQRIFSMYEFSIEVAARFLVHPNLTSAIQMSERLRVKARGVSTLDIWPWRYLVPWMREDLFNRRDLRGQESREIKEVSDSYDAEDIAMPLFEFINDPIAHEIIHNGATFQVAGLTNSSYSSESHKVRHCVRRYPELGDYVLDVAKNRLDHMLYVGVTEDHKESATMFANMVGAQVLSQSEALDSPLVQEESNKTDVSTFPYSEVEGGNQTKHSNNVLQTDSVKRTSNRTVGGLIKSYEVCIPSLRKSQATRRTNSLRKIAPVNFSKEARARVPESLILKLSSLNALDMALYEHAKEIFLQQQERLADNHKAVNENHLLFEAGKMSNNMYGYNKLKVFMLAFSLFLITVLIFMVVSGRRTFKLKV